MPKLFVCKPVYELFCSLMVRNLFMQLFNYIVILSSNKKLTQEAKTVKYHRLSNRSWLMASLYVRVILIIPSHSACHSSLPLSCKITELSSGSFTWSTERTAM